jgi:hypothetical protein
MRLLSKGDSVITESLVLSYGRRISCPICRKGLMLSIPKNGGISGEPILKVPRNGDGRRLNRSSSASSERNHQKLRQLQWRIDMERAKHDNPLGQCIALHKMLIDYLWSDDGLYVAVPELLIEAQGKLENMAGLIRALIGSEPGSRPASDRSSCPISDTIPPRSCMKQALSLPN